MSILEQIKAAHGPQQFTLDIPEWGVTVTARRLTGLEYIDLADNLPDGSDRKKNFAFMVKLVGASLLNEDGTRLFVNGDDSILSESPSLTARLGKRLMELNGLDKADAKKNSATTTSDASPSGSA